MNAIKYLLILFFGTLISYGQQPPNIVPPSPEAASLLKFTEVPVSLHTGVPNISIPLFEIESGGVTVPISISYHASGIKVAEIASRVGLGWTLNCGGLVSRQIRFNADDINSDQRADFNGFFTNQDQAKRDSEHSKLEIYDHPPGSLYDAIPDQYYYNVNGLSGKFIYDYTDGQVLVQQFSDIKITSGGQTITDGQGNTYLFGDGSLGDYDRSMQSLTLNETAGYTITNPTAEPIYRNTWHLTKIKTQKGPEITFSYADDVSQFYRRTFDKYEQGFPIAQSGYKGFVTYIQSLQKMVSRIDFDKGYITFEYETRYDVSNGKRLKGVTLYNTSNQIVRQVALTYQDVLSADDDNMQPNLKTLDAPARTRMYLKTVQFKYGTQTLPPYTFEYDDTPLPNRHSNSQDIWGYYNGKANGHCLKNDNEYSTLGHRTVDTTMAAAGMLKKIIYPEGGYTRFYYEHNKVYNPFPDDVVFDNPNPYVALNAHLSNIEFTTAAVYYAGINQYVYKKPFTISTGVAGGYLKYTFDNNNFIYKIRNIANVEVYNLSTIDQGTTQVGNGSGSVSLFYLPPGDYFLEVTAPVGHDPTNPPIIESLDAFTVHIDWVETTPSNDPILTAGKRIKKIEYRDPFNNQGITKTYNYNNPDTGQTSGLLFGLPNFRSLEEKVTTVGGQEFQLFDWQGNFPGSPLVTYQEQSQGYGIVTEFNGEGNTTLGKTVHTFTMTPDMGEYYRFPLHPPTDNEYLRGKELSVTHYKKNINGSFTAVKKIENEYLYGDDVISTLYPFPYRKPIYEGMAESGYVKNRRRFRLPLALFYDGQYGHTTELDTIYPTMYKAYQLTGGTVDLKKTTVTDYFDNGTQMVNITDYGYRYDYHYNLSQENKVASDGTSVISKTFYPADPEMAGRLAVADLLANNMRQIPLVSQSFRGSTKLSETETIFKDWHPANSKRVMEPEYVKTATGTDATEYRLRFVARDSVNGNLFEVQQTNGTSVSYIWGYKKAYPIARIENAAYTAISSYVNALQTASDNGSLTQSSFTTLRNALPNAMITTYTYTPFIGVTSIADPKGYTLYYDYDPMGRLWFVKDKDPATGNFRLLSEKKYNYRP